MTKVREVFGRNKIRECFAKEELGKGCKYEKRGEEHIERCDTKQISKGVPEIQPSRTPEHYELSVNITFPKPPSVTVALVQRLQKKRKKKKKNTWSKKKTWS